MSGSLVGTHGKVDGSVETGIFRVSLTRHAPNVSLPAHDHPLASINLVLSGVVEERVGASPFLLEAGFGAARPAGAGHSNAYGRDAVDCVLLEFPDPEGCIDEPVALDPRIIRSAGQAIVRALEAGDGPDLPLLDDLCHLLHGEATGEAERHVTDVPGWMKSAIAMLRDEPAQTHSATSLAARVGVHPAHLCRQFKRSVGHTPGQYLHVLRVGRSLHAVRATTAPLSGIAASLGFADQSHFTRVFKDLVGCTPGAMRRARGARRAAEEGVMAEAATAEDATEDDGTE